MLPTLSMIALSPQALLLLKGVLVAYLVGLLLLSLYAKSKIRNEADYLVAGRRLPLFLTWGTLLATWFGAAAMAGAMDAAREEGIIGNVLDPFACAVTLVLAGLFFAKPLWRMKLLTMGDFYRRKFGVRSEVLASLIQVPAYFGWIAAQYVALASVQYAYFDIPMKYGILIAAGVTLTYTMLGGMWSVTLTDTVQMVIALLGLVVLAASTFGAFGEGSVLAGVTRMLSETPDEHLTLLPQATAMAVLAWVGTWATGLFGNIPGQDLQQRVFSAKSEKVASQACIMAGVLYLLFGLIPVGLGLLSNLTDPDYEGKILPLLAGNYLHPVMAMVFVVAFTSIVVSTATSAVLAPAAILAHNLLGRAGMLSHRKLLLDRLSVLIVASGGITLAYTNDSIMDLLDVSLSIALAGLFVPLVAGLYLKTRGELPALLSMALGFGFWFARYLVEEAFIRMPKELAESGIEYNQYVASVFSPEQFGEAISSATALLATLPADLYGLGASVIGYLVGQEINRRRAVEHDPTDPEADETQKNDD